MVASGCGPAKQGWHGRAKSVTLGRHVAAMENGLHSLGKALMLMGGLVLAMGALLVLLGLAWRAGLPRLPGDLLWRKGNFTLYFPLVTMLLLSLLLTIVLNLVARFWRR